MWANTTRNFGRCASPSCTPYGCSPPSTTRRIRRASGGRDVGRVGQLEKEAVVAPHHKLRRHGRVRRLTLVPFHTKVLSCVAIAFCPRPPRCLRRLIVAPAEGRGVVPGGLVVHAPKQTLCSPNASFKWPPTMKPGGSVSSSGSYSFVATSNPLRFSNTRFRPGR